MIYYPETVHYLTSNAGLALVGKYLRSLGYCLELALPLLFRADSGLCPIKIMQEISTRNPRSTAWQLGGAHACGGLRYLRHGGGQNLKRNWITTKSQINIGPAESRLTDSGNSPGLWPGLLRQAPKLQSAACSNGAYRSRASTPCCDWLAWASMAVAACEMICDLARAVDSFA